MNGNRTQLEYGTKLVRRGQGFWRVSLYREAGEGIFLFHPAAREGVGAGGWESEPDEARRIAERRARTRVRRYCATHRLNRLGTLTYRGEGCHDPVSLRGDVGTFFRRLRGQLGGEALPYLWTSEWHKTGHGLHVHFAVGRYVRRAVIEEAWPHGFVHIKLLGDLPYAATSLEESRMAARYLSKYVSKALGEQRPGLHRYEVAQGFSPRSIGAESATSEELFAWASAEMDGAPAFESRSSEWAGYRGPSAVFVSWT